MCAAANLSRAMQFCCASTSSWLLTFDSRISFYFTFAVWYFPIAIDTIDEEKIVMMTGSAPLATIETVTVTRPLKVIKYKRLFIVHSLRILSYSGAEEAIRVFICCLCVHRNHNCYLSSKVYAWIDRLKWVWYSNKIRRLRMTSVYLIHSIPFNHAINHTIITITPFVLYMAIAMHICIINDRKRSKWTFVYLISSDVCVCYCVLLRFL